MPEDTRLRDLLDQMADDAAPHGRDDGQRSGKTHQFWATQPVARADAPSAGAIVGREGFARDAVALPPGLAWSTLDLGDDAQRAELYVLLRENYVEDADALFRFDYQPAFLEWALRPPGHRPHWHVCIRASAPRAADGIARALASASLDEPESGAHSDSSTTDAPSKCSAHGDTSANGRKPATDAPSKCSAHGDSTASGRCSSDEAPHAELGELVAFISGVPLAGGMRICGEEVCPVAEINFLCVHKRLRAQRLAPLLIREITRRATADGVLQAVYTAAAALPGRVATARYFHRPLDYAHLVAAGFAMGPPRGCALADYAARYVLPAPSGDLRPMRPSDVPGAARLLDAFLGRFAFAPRLTADEVAHWLLPRAGVVHTYVRPDAADAPAALVSFYELPSRVVSPQSAVSEVRAAYLFYYAAADEAALLDAVHEALCHAAAAGLHVFNCVDVMWSGAVLRPLRFAEGDGTLHYYVYNWRAPQLRPSDVGLVML